MFQALIDQAHNMVNRLYACAEKGRGEVPLAVAIRYSEFEAWETTAFGIINTVFGSESTEVARWRALTERRTMLLVEARRSDLKRGEFFGLIDYFNLAAGVLREYEALYQHVLSAATSPEGPPVETVTTVAMNGTTDLASVPAPEPVRHASNSHDREFQEPPVVRRVADNQWNVIVAVNNEVYTWLSDMAALRDRTSSADGDAIARLATTIIERVAMQTQRSRASG